MVDRHDVQQALDNITRRKVPDTVDLWAAIKAEIEPQKLRSTLWLGQFSRLAAAIVLMVIVGGGTLAAVLTISSRTGSNGSDDGFISVASLYTDLNMTQVRNDVTFTVERAYVDANRAVIDYTYTVDEAIMDIPASDLTLTPYLTTAEGMALSVFPVTSGSGYASSGTVHTLHSTYSFDTSVIVGQGKSIDLRLEIAVATEEDISGGGGGQIDSGYGGSAWNAKLMQQPVEFSPFTFIFEFTLPTIPELVIEGIEPVTSDGIAVSVERLRIAPSLTRLTLCFDRPDLQALWIPVFTIASADYEQTYAPYRMGEMREDHVCATETYAIPYVPGHKDTWTITVHFLRSGVMDTADNATELERLLEAQGISGDVVSANTGEEVIMLRGTLQSMTEGPEDFDLAYERAHAALGVIIEGPWVFEVEVE